MPETLYKTKTPEASVSECYELILEKKLIHDRHVYFVREIHGWWDEQQGRFIHEQFTLSPDEGYATNQEATEQYNLQRLSRARSGFTHSFSPLPKGHPEGQYHYQHIISD